MRVRGRVARALVVVTTLAASEAGCLSEKTGVCETSGECNPGRLCVRQRCEPVRPFVPSQISRPLVAWLDARQIPAAIGSPLPVWPDASGLHNDFRQADPGKQPFLIASDVGPAVSFETDLVLSAADARSTRPPSLSVLIVLQSLSAPTPIIGYPVVDATGAGVDPFWQWTLFRSFNDAVEVRIDVESLSGPVPKVWNWQSRGLLAYRSEPRDVYRDASWSFALAQPGTPRFIKYPDPPGPGIELGGFKGEANEVLLFDGTVTDDELRSLTAYLLDKWHLQ